MKLYAISDLHVGFEANRDALASIRPHRDDWLILGGDVCETEEDLLFALDVLGSRFAKLIWVPGNHELWTTHADGLRGEAKYRRFVSLCTERGVVTPEGAYPIWPGEGGEHLIAPLFLLYDYTFRPNHVPVDQAVAWAAESGIQCADESLLHPDPFPSRSAWCHARCEATATRLDEATRHHDRPTVIVNHFPLRHELARLPAIPRFQIWCGTRSSEDWHRRYRASVVVSGHLHIRRTAWVDGVRFEEVSLGYPRQWNAGHGLEHYLRQILPHPVQPPR